MIISLVPFTWLLWGSGPVPLGHGSFIVMDHAFIVMDHLIIHRQRILFETRDLSLVKNYLCRQWDKIQQGTSRIPVRDFIFCKDVKLGHYRGQPPPGAEVVKKSRVFNFDYFSVPFI